LLKKLPDSFQMEIFGGSPIRFSTLKVWACGFKGNWIN
jgi:hypothetical protein